MLAAFSVSYASRDTVFDSAILMRGILFAATDVCVSQHGEPNQSIQHSSGPLPMMGWNVVQPL